MNTPDILIPVPFLSPPRSPMYVLSGFPKQYRPYRHDCIPTTIPIDNDGIVRTFAALGDTVTYSRASRASF